MVNIERLTSYPYLFPRDPYGYLAHPEPRLLAVDQPSQPLLPKDDLQALKTSKKKRPREASPEAAPRSPFPFRLGLPTLPCRGFNVGRCCYFQKKRSLPLL